MAIPRTTGRQPNPRTLPAFPKRILLYKILETNPREHIHLLETVNNHPDLDFNTTLSLKILTTIKLVPAARANTEPKKGLNSTL